MRTDRPRHAVLATLGAALLALAGQAAGFALAQSPTPASPNREPVANLGRPLTTEELNETRVAVAMTGDQAVVVAIATVSTDRVDPDPACDPVEAACPYGRLVGLATDDVVEVVARADVAAQLPGGITGSIALALVGSGVELLGQVSSTIPRDPAVPGAGYLVPVTADSIEVASSLGTGWLIVVDGWLQTLGLAAPCSTGRGFPEDTPFDLCRSGWITAAPFFPSTDDDLIPMQPPGFGIIVQPNAYGEFAADPQPYAGHATDPRRAVYLLRRVATVDREYGEIAGWQVIARLDPIE